MSQQDEFDWLVPTSKELLRSDEIARILNQSEDFVYQLRQEGRLECHSHPDRKVKRFRATRRSLLIYLAESAEYHNADRDDRILKILPHLSPAGLTRAIDFLTRLRAKKLST